MSLNRILVGLAAIAVVGALSGCATAVSKGEFDALEKKVSDLQANKADKASVDQASKLAQSAKDDAAAAKTAADEAMNAANAASAKADQAAADAASAKTRAERMLMKAMSK